MISHTKEKGRERKLDWVSGIQNALNYIEAHITEQLDYDCIAREACSSSFHFQRVFSILCGYTLGEYIRHRRLSLAGQELLSGTDKIIDIAGKYGYNSPDSFTKAFQKFHGITPTQARSNPASLKITAPIRIRISLESGESLSPESFSIKEKPEMLLTGFGKQFAGSPNRRREQDHIFSCKTRLYQYILQGMSHDCATTYQILKDFTNEGYNFYFAYHLPQWALQTFQEDLGEIASCFEHIKIPAGQYLVCKTERCEFPTLLIESLRKQAVAVWLPSSGYILRDAPEVEVIHWFWEEGNEELNHSRYIEIWIPVEEKKTFDFEKGE